MEAGETPEFAAVRELEEELGIGIDPGVLVPVGFASGWSAPPADGSGDLRRPLVILLYACSDWAGTPRGLEAEVIAWRQPGTIGNLPMPPLDYPLAAALCRHLGVIS